MRHPKNYPHRSTTGTSESQPLLPGFLDSLEPSNHDLHAEVLRNAIPPVARLVVMPQHDAAAIQRVAESLSNFSARGRELLAHFLVARGLGEPDRIHELLNPSLADIPPPTSVKNLAQAAHRVVKAIAKKESIGIVGDYDVDGVTSVAQLVRFLGRQGVSPSWHIPNRALDGYGISGRIVGKLLNDSCSLVLLVDHGTHSVQEVQALRRGGADVIILDHHQITGEVAAGLLVSPHQEGCGLHTSSPCASLLSWYLVWMCEEVRTGRRCDPPGCGLAGMGTIADVMPLSGVNRMVAATALRELRDVRTVPLGLQQLALQLGVDLTSLSSSDVAFYLGPAINAAGRLNDAGQCVELLTTSDPLRARTIARSLHEINERRKVLQQESFVRSMRTLWEGDVHGARAPSGANLPLVIVDHHSDNHPGVVGLGAQALASRYGRPAISIAPCDHGASRGSGRVGDPELHLLHIVERAKERLGPGVILKGGGHRAACGVSVAEGKVGRFAMGLNAAARELYPTFTPTVQVRPDCVMPLEHIKATVVREFQEALEPFGQGFEALQCFIPNVTVRSVDYLPGGRMRISVASGEREVAGFVGPEIATASIKPNMVVSLVATPISVYRSRKEMVQLRIAAIIPHTVAEEVPPREVRSSREVPRLERSADKPKQSEAHPKQRVSGGSRIGELERDMLKARGRFAREFLYDDLNDLMREYDFGVPPQVGVRLLQALKDEYRLPTLRVETMQYRPEQIELIRYLLDTAPRSVMIQAPTGKGKTEIAIAASDRVVSEGGRIVFLAPTTAIVKQVVRRVPRMIGCEAVALDGAVSPTKREAIYRERDPQWIVAVPHVISNDLVSGSFSFRATDLLIIDEAHHTGGKYPFVPVAEAAKSAGARVIAMTATPAEFRRAPGDCSKGRTKSDGNLFGKDEDGSGWERLAELKQVLGVKTMLPMSTALHRPEIVFRKVERSSEMVACEKLCWEGITLVYERMQEKLYDLGDTELLPQINDELRISSGRWPSLFTMKGILRTTLAFGGRDRGYLGVLSQLRAIGEFSEIRRVLMTEGARATLLRIVTKRLAIAAAEIENPAYYIRTVYNSAAVRQVYQQLALGSFVLLWSERALLERVMSNTAERDTKKEYQRRKKQLLDELSQEYEAATIPDHPKEDALCGLLLEHPGEQALVFVRGRPHAAHLARVISSRLGDNGVRAEAFTGVGGARSDTLTRKEREARLERFRSGETQVLVLNSAGFEGLDIARVPRAVMFDFSASGIQSSQCEGRIGRDGATGEVVYLYSSEQEYAKCLAARRKLVEGIKLLNDERERAMREFGKGKGLR